MLGVRDETDTSASGLRCTFHGFAGSILQFQLSFVLNVPLILQGRYRPSPQNQNQLMQ